jgi:hypothetical protein
LVKPNKSIAMRNVKEIARAAGRVEHDDGALEDVTVALCIADGRIGMGQPESVAQLDQEQRVVGALGGFRSEPARDECFDLLPIGRSGLPRVSHSPRLSVVGMVSSSPCFAQTPR